jgi:hypothetical protein
MMSQFDSSINFKRELSPSCQSLTMTTLFSNPCTLELIIGIDLKICLEKE